MLSPSLLLALLLPLLASSAPTSTVPNSEKRAGAPIPTPLPSTCTLTYPAPQKPSLSSSYYQPSVKFASKHSLYQYVTYAGETPSPEQQDQVLHQCLETCYGYGYKGDCRSVFVADNVPTVVYGTEVTGTVCQLFSKALRAGDFVAPVVEGSYGEPRAVDLSCPK